MRQVPQYLIVGNGRVARHVCHYFSLLNIPVLTWNRSESFDLLHEKIQQVSHILLLISGIVVGFTLPVLAYYLYWYIGLVMEENELHKDNTDER